MNFSRLFFLLTLIFFTIFSCESEKENNIRRPNILLFLIDDFGYADISYEGNTQIKTPNIDRIAENGAHFTRFYQSGAACAPTRASLLTGRYHLHTGLWGVHQGRDFIHRDESNIGDVLQDAGYVTGAFGKWHSGKIWPYFSWNRGFDVGVHSRLYQYYDTRVIYNNKIINVEGPITDVIGDQVIRFIEENKERPFFAYVPFQAIHEPYNCPPEVFEKYKKAGYTDHVARLYGMIEVLDDNIGRILNRVEQLGLMENTVVLFLNDDGPSPGYDLSYQNRRMNAEEKAERRRGWARELRGGKGSIWEGGMITPFYIRWDGEIDPGVGYPHLTGVIDLLPTILDICKVDYRDQGLPLHGRSFWPILNGDVPGDWEERKHFDNTNFYLIPRAGINRGEPEMHHIAVHYKDFKLIRGNEALYGGKDSVYYELYNLVTDPGEQENIIENEPEISAQLIIEIEKWWKEVLESDRAFKQAVYEIGNWEERSTPINLDAVKDLHGSVQPASDAHRQFVNWTRPGAAITYEIDASAAGAYVVELGYHCDPASLGSVFFVHTAYDTARVLIDDTDRAFSDTLHLPSGPQTLTIELVSLGEGNTAVNVLDNLLIHRVAGNEDQVLLNSGMEVSGTDGNKKIFYSTSATADFMFGRTQGNPLEVKKGELLTIKPFADNLELVQDVTFYFDFEPVSKTGTIPFEFTIEVSEKGRHTLNAEFRSKSGVVHAVHGDVIIE